MTTLGPLIVDIASTQLSSLDREVLSHPLVGGVILFSRNFANYQQLSQLTQDIRAIRTPRLLITVDHEGGRVQRWRKNFTAIPAMGSLGKLYDQFPAKAVEHAFHYGQITAKELVAIGLDLNFAPVLDMNYGVSQVINQGRSFHRDIQAISSLASAYIAGLNSMGMNAIGKHFPGHGGVIADSHFTLPNELRSVNTILQNDIKPFQNLIMQNQLAGIMTAHILYPDVDNELATTSSFWLKKVLRQQLKFAGAIISDDLNMQAMKLLPQYQSILSRVRKALAAGCNLLLLCNNPAEVQTVLKQLSAWPDTTQIIAKLYAKYSPLP